MAVLAGALLSPVCRLRQRGRARPHPRRCDRRGRAAAPETQRNGDHAGGARPDRRGDDLEPAHHGDRRRLRDLRLAAGPGEPPRPARVAVARQCLGAEGKARHRDHRHLLDPPAEDVHQRRRVRRENAYRADWHSYHLPAVRDGDCRQRQDHAQRQAGRARMTTIRKADLIQSVADALQFISYYHPADYIRALGRAYEREQSPAAKDAIAQILTNSRMCAEGHRPICQDTGIVNVFLKIGMGVRFDFADSLEDAINEGVRRAYLDPDNKLRASVLDESDFGRKNTKDNTPAVISVQMVPGDKLEVDVAAKGGGSEAKAKFVMLNPSDSIAEWVLKTVPTMGAGWCPPGMLGIGVGGTAEKAMLMAKEALMESIDMAELKARGPQNKVEELRVELYDKVNALGIGAQGLGGLSTVLDVKIKTYPVHAANRPVAMIPNCAATRHAH